MSRAWVTGARGFIGRHVALELASRGFRVAGIGHGSWPEFQREVWKVTSWMNSEVTAAGLDALAAEAGIPEVIVHLAGGSSVSASFEAPREDFARTLSASAELVEWLRTRAPDSRVVVASSAAVVGDRFEGAIPRDAASYPCSPYGAHKAAMELVLGGHARTFGLKIAVVRLFSVYGPGLEKQLIWDLCTRLVDSPRSVTLGGTGEETRDFVFVSDAAQLLAQAIHEASSECPVFNGGTGPGITVRTLATSLVRAWPSNAAVLFDGRTRQGDPRHLVADLAGSETILPLRWTPLSEGLERVVETARARLLNPPR